MKGIDPVANSISVARDHASLDPVLSGRLTYECGTMEDLLTARVQYDAVVASEVVEHVADVGLFVKQQCQLVKVSELTLLSGIFLCPGLQDDLPRMVLHLKRFPSFLTPNSAWRCGSPHYHQPHPHLICIGHRYG